MSKKYLKILAIVLATAIVVVIIFLFTQKTQLSLDSSSPYKSSVTYPTSPLTLSLWLPTEEQGNFEVTVAEYKKLHTTVDVQVTYIDSATYQTKLLQGRDTGTLPDLFVFRNDGLPLYAKALQPAPASVFTTDQFNSTFAEFATQKLTSGNTVLAAPLGLATLGLIYNTDRLKSANAETLPVTWVDFEKTNSALRKKDGQNLYSSGVALGSSAIRNYSDIMSILMMQNGASMTNQPPTQATFQQVDTSGYAPGAKALEFYASFAQPTKQNYTWSDSLGSSTEALAQNKTALVVDYPMAAKQVQKQNASFSIGLASLPQTNPSNPINYGNILSGGVAKTSKNSEIAWDFWGFSTSKDIQKKFSLASFWPASRKDLINDQLNDKDLAPFARQSSTAKDWYKGINYTANAGLRDMLNSYLAGFDSKIVVNNAAVKVTSEIQASNK
ncbi:extracellular solute-binding protein [Candidatus Saccharibacteria bacterium]|nr:extracellular solute-binding protein [Candidatus Saccharibacteria bacterium]